MKPFGPTAGRLQNRGLQVRVLPPLLAETGAIRYLERDCACFAWSLYFRCRPLESAPFGAIGANKGANSITENTAPCRSLEATQVQATVFCPECWQREFGGSAGKVSGCTSAVRSR